MRKGAFKIGDGELRIDLNELVECLSNDEQRTLARTLVADEQLFKAVLECVADSSKNGFGHYFSDEEARPWWFSPRTVLEMREKLIPFMPDIAKQSVAESLRQRDAAVADMNRHSTWAWRMYHAWPECSVRGRPELPLFPVYGSTKCPICGSDGDTKKAECKEQLARAKP